MRRANVASDHIVARIPLSTLRLQRRLAPRSAYDKPDADSLALAIVEGKRELDRATRNDLSGVSELCLAAPAAVQLSDGKFNISRECALPLPAVLSHRLIDDLHMWIGVEQGIAIVLNDDEQQLFLQLRDGVSPALVVDQCEGHSTLKSRWARVNGLIARLAVSGFIRGVLGYTDKWEAKPRRFMRVHLTQRCNLTCIHCYADSSPHVSAQGEITEERWLKLIDDFADSGGERILFTGGEALVFRGCDRLMKRSHDRGLHVSLFSNGLLIDRHLDIIRECADEVQISIDGPDAQTNDPIRGEGSYSRAKKAVDTLLAAGVRVRISMVVMQRNLEAMRQGFTKFAAQWPKGAVEYRLGYGLAQHGRGEELGDTLGIDEVRPIVDAMLEEVEGDKGPRIARSTKGCGYAEQIVVAQDGTVHPCHLLDGAITHIDAQSMPELITLLTASSREYDVDNTVGCNRCDIRNLCGGSCRILNGKTTGNRRVTNCTATDKLHRLHNLVQTFSETYMTTPLERDWE